MVHSELQKLNQLLQRHDWAYQYGDRNAYARGEEEWNEITRKVKTLGYDGQRLLNAHLEINNNPACGTEWVDREEPSGKRLVSGDGEWVFQ